MISFAPLEPDAVAFLSERTGIDFSIVDFTAAALVLRHRAPARRRAAGGAGRRVQAAVALPPDHAIDDMTCLTPSC